MRSRSALRLKGWCRRSDNPQPFEGPGIPALIVCPETVPTRALMDLIFDDDHCDVRIKWSRPTDLQSAKQVEDDNDLLYMITAQDSRGADKMVYIGQAYSQKVAKRTSQPVHRRKQAAWAKSLPGHTFKIRRGLVSLAKGRGSVDKINAIEAILIYCFDSEHCMNGKGGSDRESWASTRSSTVVTEVGFLVVLGMASMQANERHVVERARVRRRWWSILLEVARWLGPERRLSSDGITCLADPPNLKAIAAASKPSGSSSPAS